MKLNIAGKLILMMLLTTAMVVGLIFGMTRYSISSGFASYVEKAELSELDTLAKDLEQKYSQTNSWNFLRQSPNEMWWLFGHNELTHLERGLDNSQFARREVSTPATQSSYADGAPQGAPPPYGERPPGPPPWGQGPPPDGPPPQGPPGGPPPQGPPPPWGQGRPEGPPPGGPPPYGAPPQSAPPPANPQTREQRVDMPPAFPEHRKAFFNRVALFDKGGSLVWGNKDAATSKQSLPLTLNGNAIGYLKLIPSQTMSKDIEGEFIAAQNHNLQVVSIVAFVMAALFAIVLSQDLVRAVLVLVDGTRNLTAGKLSSRIALTRSDELGELANDFNSLADTLERHERAQKQWITDTSHELRTPIAVLRAQVEALQDGIQPANARTLDILHKEILTLSKLVDDLHDLAKSDLGELRYDFVPVDVGAVLQDCTEAFLERFAAKHIKLDATNIQDLHCILEGDGTRLRQLFSNLMENSLRYTNEDGQLRISALQTPAVVTILFDDSAPGVPENLIDKIFDRFYRTEASRSRVSGGAGLGLSICKTIAEAHRGQISAGNSELGGVKITVQLPLKG